MVRLSAFAASMESNWLLHLNIREYNLLDLATCMCRRMEYNPHRSCCSFPVDNAETGLGEGGSERGFFAIPGPLLPLAEAFSSSLEPAVNGEVKYSTVHGDENHGLDAHACFRNWRVRSGEHPMHLLMLSRRLKCA